MKNKSLFLALILAFTVCFLACKKDSDFRDAFAGTYQLKQIATLEYTCVTYGPPGGPTCLKRDTVQTYKNNEDFQIVLSYDASVVVEANGTAPMISNKPWDDAKFTANQATKELKFHNSNYYTQDVHTIKIKGDSIFYETYYQGYMTPEFRKTYRSGVRIK